MNLELKLYHYHAIRSQVFSKNTPGKRVCADKIQGLIGSEDLIVVGAAGMYEARCRRCFESNLTATEAEKKKRMDASVRLTNLSASEYIKSSSKGTVGAYQSLIR